MTFSLDDDRPDISPDAWIAPGAVVVGRVTLADHVSVWFNAVLRGDNDTIEIGEGSNVQDGAVLHVDPGYPIRVGRRVTIGHAAVVHGCTLGDESLVGMNAVVLNGAKVGAGCLIGANALVTEGTEVPDGSLVLGSPAKVVKTLDEAARARIVEGAEVYMRKIARYRDGLVAN